MLSYFLLALRIASLLFIIFFLTFSSVIQINLVTKDEILFRLSYRKTKTRMLLTAWSLALSMKFPCWLYWMMEVRVRW